MHSFYFQIINLTKHTTALLKNNWIRNMYYLSTVEEHSTLLNEWHLTLLMQMFLVVILLSGKIWGEVMRAICSTFLQLVNLQCIIGQLSHKVERSVLTLLPLLNLTTFSIRRQCHQAKTFLLDILSHVAEDLTSSCWAKHFVACPALASRFQV